MTKLTSILWDNLGLRRGFIVFFSTIAILSTAQSCSIPGFNNNNNNPNPATYGILKKGDPNIQGENFVKANAATQLDGKVNASGLATLSGIKLVQFDPDNLFLLTIQKGIFRSTDSGRLWQRKYLFKVGSTENDQSKRNQQINAQIARNDAFFATDIAVDPTNKDRIFVSGLEGTLGKIYQSIDGGENFSEIYTEVQKNVGVLHIAVDPNNPNRVYGVLKGGGLLRSLDGGITWQKIRSFKETPLQIGFVPEFNNQFYLLFPTQGLATSKDDGENWETNQLTKEPSVIGENQPKDNLDLTSNSNKKFGKYEKIIPVNAKQNSWILIADRQIWYTTSLGIDFKKIILPLQSEQYNIFDVATDPAVGLERIFVSIDDKLFETGNQGNSWKSSDKIPFKIGNIGQILIDKSNSNIVFLVLVDPNARRQSNILGL